MREWEIGAVENIHGALPYIRVAPILALVGVGVNRIGKEDTEEEVEEAEEEEEVDESAEPFREAKVAILKFLEGSLSTFMKDGLQLDAISKFGCHLFLAGAAEAIGREHELDQKEFVKILETSVSVLGSDAEVVRRFGEKYDEYLLEHSYARMFKAGGEAMEQVRCGRGRCRQGFV